MAIAFDASYYLLHNTDVASAISRGQFPDAYAHYVQFGARELRNPNVLFNAHDYLTLNPDVATAVPAGIFASVWDHYVAFGLAENRAPSVALSGFDAAGYLAINGDVAAAVAAGSFKSAMEHYLLHGQAEGRTWGEDVPLTNGTDKLVANKFVAGLVYTPGGNDRINSLQDEDELTGIGTNPTLTATLGNANDNGGSVITPILKGIETVNVAFSGSGTGLVTTLDLQDATGLTGAVNVTRISLDVGPVGITNMASIPAELSVSNNNAPTSGVLFQFLDTAAVGTADVTKLTVSNVDMNNLVVRSKGGDNGIETINLVTSGAQANRVGNLTAQDLVTLTISGAQNLTIGSIGDGNVGQFRSIDGSTATGNLTLSLDSELKADMEGTSGTGVAVDFQLKTGSGNDTLKVNVATAGNVADTIAMGAGTDTVAFTADASTVFTDKTSATFTGVEAVTVVRTEGAAAATLTVDLSRLASDTGTDQTIRLTNAGTNNSATFVLNNLTAGEAGQITLTHSATDQNGVDDTTVVANLADNKGSSDTVAVTIVDGVNTDERFNFALTAAGVENITLIDSDTESNTIRLDSALEHTGIITLTGGVAGQFLNLDHSENVLDKNPAGYGNDGTYINNTATGTNTGALVASEINAEAYVGDVILRVSSTPTAVSATGAQTIRMGAGNDFVVFDNLNDSRAGLTISDTVSGGAGSDTLAIAGSVAVDLGASEWTNVSGFETIRLLGNGADYKLSLTDQLITRNAADGKLINIVNDGDIGKDGEGTRTLSAVTIDARALSVGLNFSYNGEEGTKRTSDRFIFTDAQINSTAVIDGGAVDIVATTAGANDDVLEVRNAAVISAGDLANISNIGTIELTNDRAAVQNFTVQLTDAIVDAMVDSYHTSTAAGTETLTIKARDNELVSGAHSVLHLEAGDLTARSSLNVYGGGGVDTIIVGAGSDFIYGGLRADLITLAVDNARDTILIFSEAEAGDIITGFQGGAADTTDLLTLTNGFGAGDGDVFLENGVKVATSAFSNTAEMVIITSTAADMTLANVAAAIGSATAAYAMDAVAIFAVSNGTDTGIYRFQSSAADALVSAGELTLVGTLKDINTTALELNNFSFGLVLS